MTSLPGGLKAQNAATPEVQEIANQVKSAAEQKAGKTFDKFEAKSFSTQVVAGVNYFIKVDVGSEHIHLRVYKDLQQHLSLSNIQQGKSAEDPISYF